MDLQLIGKRAAVAAASAGLGYATAASLRSEGAQVAICGRTRDTVDAAAKQIGAVPFVTDVSDPTAAADFITRSCEALGGLDILVVNAGGPPVGRYTDFKIEDYLKALHLNLLSTVAMCGAALPGMRQQKWGRIVAITSMSARRPKPNAVLTTTARAGATAFLKALSIDVAPDGVTVNSVQTGYHATNRLTQLYGADVDNLAKTIPAGHVGKASDFGAIVAFLCSQQANFITGVSLPVDGGAYPALY